MCDAKHTLATVIGGTLQSIRPILACSLLVMLSGCVWLLPKTVSPQCKAAMSECLKECRDTGPQPTQDLSNSTWFAPTDQRSSCRRACHQICQ